MRNETPIYWQMRNELIKAAYIKSRPLTKWEQVKAYFKFLWGAK